MRTRSGEDESRPDLVDAAVRGDREAFALVVDPLLRTSLGAARLITGNEADAADAVQDALLKAWQSLPKLRHADRFPAWFRQIVVRSALRSVERKRRLVELDLDAPASANALDREIDLRRLERAFAELDEKDRVVLALHHYWRLPVAETSRILGIPEGTVRSRVHHALQRLRAAFDSEQRS